MRDVDDLQKLADLRDRGVLTEEEFAAKRQQILSRPAGEAPSSRQVAQEGSSATVSPKRKAGKILSVSTQNPSVLSKAAGVLGMILLLPFEFLGVFLCLTIVGAIIGIPLLVGCLAADLACAALVWQGEVLSIECPTCGSQQSLTRTAMPEFLSQLQQKTRRDVASSCSSCGKRIILRGGEVLSVE